MRLDALMHRTAGKSEMIVALIDGPVFIDHPDLVADRIRRIGDAETGTCVQRAHPACEHGTFNAGVLAARRGVGAPAICPECTLLIRAVFSDRTRRGDPSGASARRLADAILSCVAAGARVLNISAALYRSDARDERGLVEALDEAARRGAIVVVAAGNDRSIGSTALTGHPWVIPVVACDADGRPAGRSNYGRSIGQRGLSAPGERVVSLRPGGGSTLLSGTSVAAPFVTGTVALLWSEFPSASASEIASAVRGRGRRGGVVPPLLDAWSAYETLEREGAHV
ncbi:S8 family serine peptidase [Spirillospora sp. CA-253888]